MDNVPVVTALVAAAGSFIGVLMSVGRFALSRIALELKIRNQLEPGELARANMTQALEYSTKRYAQLATEREGRRIAWVLLLYGLFGVGTVVWAAPVIADGDGIDLWVYVPVFALALVMYVRLIQRAAIRLLAGTQ